MEMKAIMEYRAAGDNIQTKNSVNYCLSKQ